ncbi:hypothetical protein M2372_000658 [Chryseobacterium sp. BIGb0232]|nr:hypothetical protein [Chryseobacterium sp. BIGb0232]ROS19913.1 hypothetical protein EDF65_0611 [Chryseobacterium nakagawai]
MYQITGILVRWKKGTVKIKIKETGRFCYSKLLDTIRLKMLSGKYSFFRFPVKTFIYKFVKADSYSKVEVLPLFSS